MKLQMETKKIDKHSSEYRLSEKPPVCPVVWLKTKIGHRDNPDSNFAFMGSLLLGTYDYRDEKYMGFNKEYQVWLSVPNVMKYTKSLAQAKKMIEESYVYIKGEDEVLARTPKSKEELIEIYRNKNSMRYDSICLQKIDTGEIVNVYYDRKRYLFTLRSKKPFCEIVIKKRNKPGLVSVSYLSNLPIEEKVEKLIEKIYPKQDYLHYSWIRSLPKNDDSNLFFGYDGISSLVFENKLKEGLKQIADKYNLILIYGQIDEKK